MMPTMTSVPDAEAQREANRLREANLKTVPGVRIKLSEVDALIELGLFTEDGKKDPNALAKLVADGFSRHARDAQHQRAKQAEEKAEAEAGAMTISISAHVIQVLSVRGFLWGSRPYSTQALLDALKTAADRRLTLAILEDADVDPSRAQDVGVRQIPVSTAFQPSGRTGRGAGDFNMGPRGR